MFCIFHKWVNVEDSALVPYCKFCIQETKELEERLHHEIIKPRCRYSGKVCKKCGKTQFVLMSGKSSVVPDCCKEQVKYMRALFSKK